MSSKFIEGWFVAWRGFVHLNRFRTLFMVSTLLLAVVALAVTGALNIVSFRQNYTNSLVSSYAVVANQPVRKIQYALGYGKPLENFYGMTSLLQEIRHNNPNISSVQVVTLTGQVLYNLHGPADGEVIPADLRAILRQSITSATGYAFTRSAQNDSLFVPIWNGTTAVGAVRMEFPAAVIDQPVNRFLDKLLGYLGAFALLSAAVLIPLFLKVRFVTADGHIMKRRLLITLISVLGGIQVCYAIPNYELLAGGYLGTVKENTKLVVRVIKEDMHSVVNQGVPYIELNGLSTYLRQIILKVPEIQSVSIVNSDFTTNPNNTGGTLAGYTYSVPLGSDASGSSNYSCIVVLSQPFIAGKTVEILLDALTIMVVSFLLTYEFIVTTLMFLRRGVTTANLEDDEEIRRDRSAVRPAGFGIFAAVYLTSAFTPLIMNGLYRPLFGLPKVLVIGLPISVEMGCVAIASIVSGYLTDSKGWKPVFVAGSVLLLLGTLISAATHNELVFMGARALAGLGFGADLVAMQNFVVSTRSETHKNQGLSALNSGAYAGINTGTVIGGIIAEHLGFSAAFLMAAVVILAGLLYALFYLPGTKTLAVGEASVPSGQVAGFGMLDFMANRKVSLFFVAILLPVSMCGMFLYYYFPVFASSHGVNTADIGRAFLLNGLCIVYVGPLLTRFTDKFLGYQRAVVVSGLLTASAILWFSLHSVPWTAFVVVVLLGLSDSFGVTANINYFISTPASLRLGEGKAMGYYGLVENVGQMAGPIAFGLAAAGSGEGIMALAGLLAVGSAGFFAFNGRGKTEALPGPGVSV